MNAPSPPRSVSRRALLAALATGAATAARGADDTPSGARLAASSAGDAAAAAADGGTIEVLPPFEIPVLRRPRRVRVWLPPSYGTAAAARRRYPVLYLHDGQNLFDGPGVPWGGWGVGEAMSTLAREQGAEALLVAIDHGGEHRLTELSPWPNARGLPVEGPAYLDFVTHVLKPWIDARFRTRPGRAHTLMGGSSLGGLATHAALARSPRVWGAGLVFSPAYWFCAPSDFAETRAHPWPRDTRAWLYVGGAEGDDMVPDAQRMARLLAAQGRPAEDLVLRVVAGAHHDERAWRAEFPRAAAWLLGAGAGAGARRAAPA